MKIKYSAIFLLLLLIFSFSVKGQAQSDTIIKSNDTFWVDSVLKSLTTEEKIAQLLMVRAYSNKSETHYKEISGLITKYNIGGLCFFQGGPVRQANLTNRYQKLAKTPLFIALDAEWGLGMRLDSSFSFPYQMTMGAMDYNEPVYQTGAEIAHQLKTIGVNINFAPVVDINNNPDNPVINSRSFGEDKEIVAAKGIAYMRGIQDNGIIATAKHFPGHGDTGSDSHKTLPVINKSRESLDSLEFYPFKELIRTGLNAVMIAHLFVPSLDSTKNTPTTLSKNVVTDILSKKDGFEGLIVTDALDMRGVTNYYKPGDIELKALLAGNDILLLPQNVDAAVKTIKQAVDNGEVTEELIDIKCKKILEWKYKAGLNSFDPIKTDTIYRIINNPNNELITRKIFKSAITVVRNQNDIIPLMKLDTLQMATLSIGNPELNDFQLMLENYAAFDHYNLLKSFPDIKANNLIKKLSEYNLIVVGIQNTSIFPNKNFGISKKSLEFVSRLADSTNVVLAMFASPYALKLIEQPEKFESIIVAFQDTDISENITAQVIMGAAGAKGHLPVSAGENFQAGFGIETKEIGRLQYTIPEEAGIDEMGLKAIDTLVLYNIKKRAIPGCQILIAKDGMVIYNKSFGYHTYHKGNFVKNSDIYDLASVTKIAATTVSVMKLTDENKIDIDQHLVRYLPYLKNTNKENIVIREMMAHQARLKPWIPFYANTMNNGKLDRSIYSKRLNDEYTVKVADNIYIRNDYKYTLYDSIVTSKLRKSKKYKYSDLGFYFMKEIVESSTNESLDRYVNNSFYKPMGMTSACFNPRNHIKLKDIVPTENDNYFRHQLVHGYVHDPGAAMLGGVSGHAGLFANANDMAKLMQMLLQKGYYGGTQYIKPETVEQFTKQQFPLNENRRGIGFDKPLPDDRDQGPTCASATLKSFGHSGFTGTYVWVDPEYNLVYIFLSNRINPTAKNTKLIKMDTRTKIQQIIYDAIGTSSEVDREEVTANALKE
jgi:beta-glucosidase-like glycosyl hydrolase/CubicO group peptidase (beta-lactamase class C family)